MMPEAERKLLDGNLCCGPNLTVGDLFKLVIPVGWTVIVLCAILAYLFSPLSKGESPRWGTSGLICVSLISGIGLSVSIYSFHRTTSSASVEWTNEQRSLRQGKLVIHMTLAMMISVLSLGLIIFFAIFASDMNKCAHKTCGADVGWSSISLITSVLWILVAWLGIKDLNRGTEGFTTGAKITNSKDDQEEPEVLNNVA